MLKALKAAYDSFRGGKVVMPRQLSWFSRLLPNTTIDFARHVGDGLGSNILMAPVLFVWRTSLESKLSVVTENEDGAEYDSKHELARLLAKPNPHTSGLAMRLAIFISWFFDGNVYLLKARDGSGRVRQLWYVPHWMMEPKTDENDDTSGVTYFRYNPGGSASYELDVTEVVHLKHGVDPRNVWKGYAQLKPLLREVFNDDEAANFVSALLLNGGVPGVVISPREAISASQEDLKATKEYIKVQFGRSKRGEPLALGAPTDVTEFGYDPQKMNLGVVRDVSEERVCALIGLPVAVVGFGSGVDQTKVGATLIELHRVAWIDCIIPNQMLIAEEIERNLRDDFVLSEEQSLGWDRRRIRALQDDQNKEAERVRGLFKDNLMKRSEAREALSLDVEDGDDAYAQDLGIGGLGLGGLADPNADPMDPEADPMKKPPMPKKMLKATKRKLTRQQTTILRAMDAVKARSEKRLDARMNEFFAKYGEMVRDAYLTIAGKGADDELRVELLFGSINMNALRAELRGIYGSHYVNVYKDSVEVLSGLHVGVNIPDSVELRVLARGGTKAGLTNLTNAAKKKALDIVMRGREEGKHPEEIARELADAVPAGPFIDARTRASLIARTETRNAQTQSALEVYRHTQGVASVMIIDNRLGGAGDADCEEADGQIVDFSTAERMLDDEHPNGTRDIVPTFTQEA